MELTKIGLFGIGLETYWDQFNGLLENLIGYQNEIKTKLSNFGVQVIDAGMIDHPEKAIGAARLLKTNDVELAFLFVSTYALSSTVLPIAQRIGCPIVILNLQPVPQLDYTKFNAIKDRGIMTGIWLEHCQACSVPEIASVFNRAKIEYNIVTGYLEDEIAWKEIEAWCAAAQVSTKMRNNRLGILGHYYNGMLDVYTDLTRQAFTFGTHIEQLEMCELKKLRDEVNQQEIQDKLVEFNQYFQISNDCTQSELERAAHTAVAVDKLIEVHKLGSLAYYYEGQPGNDYENIVTSLIAGNTILTGKGIPIAGECEVKNVQAMKIMSEFGAGGSFSEFYLMDFKDDVVFLGHDGPAHFDIGEGKVKLVPVPLYHGKPGNGLSIQMSVKHGKVTLLSVVETNQGIKLLVAEGKSVAGEVLQIGNTNSRYKFTLGAREFMNQWSMHGPAHHCAIGIGHIAYKIEKYAKIVGIEFVKIC